MRQRQLLTSCYGRSNCNPKQSGIIPRVSLHKLLNSVASRKLNQIEKGFENSVEWLKGAKGAKSLWLNILLQRFKSRARLHVKRQRHIQTKGKKELLVLQQNLWDMTGIEQCFLESCVNSPVKRGKLQTCRRINFAYVWFCYKMFVANLWPMK